MRFTAQEEYGLRCMLQLARNEEKGPLTIDQIAHNECITPHYVGKLMRILLKGGLVESTRGQKGGYTLIRSADKINIAEVIAVLDRPLFDRKYCKKFTGVDMRCVHSTECSVRTLWSSLNSAVSNILVKTTLKNLVGSRGEQRFATTNNQVATYF